MTKVIRVKERTFDTLVSSGKWTDTMDDIIIRLLKTKNVKENKKNSSTDDGSVGEIKEP